MDHVIYVGHNPAKGITVYCTCGEEIMYGAGEGWPTLSWVKEVSDEHLANMTLVEDEEVFVPIEDFVNYEISNFGRIINSDSGRELTPQPDPRGWMKVRLYRRGRGNFFYVHRLIAQAFFLNYSDDYQVALVNDNKNDLTVRNVTLTNLPITGPLRRRPTYATPET